LIKVNSDLYGSEHILSENPQNLVSLLARGPDRRPDGHRSHYAQFYDTDRWLLNSLRDFVLTGLDTGDAVVIVATQAHREGLDELLTAAGLDVSEASAAGRYLTLDAAETLTHFMVEGVPDAGRFAQSLGDVIVKASDGGRMVRVFGEMVAILWAASRVSTPCWSRGMIRMSQSPTRSAAPSMATSCCRGSSRILATSPRSMSFPASHAS